MNPTLDQQRQKQLFANLLKEKEIIVCCGAGGVGKTTSSAALGVAAAMQGQRVLVLTIDPARRLADALGIPIGSEQPLEVNSSIFAQHGILDIQGSLSLWMLQTGPVFDQMVRDLSSSSEKADKLFQTAIYKSIRQLIAGMQEYMAGESLYQFYSNKQYDLIILDTPPSRNAIDFLNAPDRILRFLDSRILKVFAPQNNQWSLFNHARKIVNRTFELVAGKGFLAQAQEFVSLFFDIFEVLKGHAQTVQEILASDRSSHILITSPDPLALQEAAFFQDILTQKKIPFGGFLLNRSLADLPKKTWEDDPKNSKHLRNGFNKLADLIIREQSLTDDHRQLIERLKRKCTSATAIATPHLGEDIEELKGLIQLAEFLLP